MAISNLKTLSSFCDQPTSIIISYLMEPDEPVSKEISEDVSRLHAAISPIWENFLNEPGRYIDSLLYNRIIDFRGSFGAASTIHLFFKHAYPLLVEIAAVSSEKALLASVVHHLKTNHFFLSFIFKEDNTSSCVYFAKQGNHFSDNRVRLAEIDSCTINMHYGDERMHILSDKTHRWYVGNTSKRSVLLHELAHLDNMLQGDYFFHPELLINSSWVWTNQEEYRVIDVQNEALEARGEWTRLSHRALFCTDREFANMPSTLKLGIAFGMGADGTVKELCDRHLTAAFDSDDRIIFSSPKHATPYAISYLIDDPKDEEIIDQVIDGKFQQATRAHKNLALLHILFMLEQSENGFDLIQTLLECIITEAPLQRRLDVIPFIQGIQKLYT